ncbi:MAG: hypothetical protein ACEY3L_04870, partial [Wolbachia sp.]
MSPNEKNSVVTEQGNDLGLNKTTQDSLNLEAAKDPKKLKERITDLLKGDTEFSKMKQGDKILVVSAASGLFTAVLPLLAVGATLAIPGAIVGLALYFAVKVAVKTVQSGYKGLKWSAEKTVDGAKYTAEKVKDASTYAAGKVRDGAVHVKDKVGEGVDSLKKSFKERDRVVFYNHAKEGAAIEKMTKFPEEDRKKAGKIKYELKKIFADKGDNSKLVKNILSGILLKIDLKIAEEAKSESIEHTPKWQVQKDFIKHLDEKDLRVLIKQKALPSDVYFIDRVFSEHHDEIKEVIAKCKEDHILKGSLKMRSNMFEEGSAKPSRSLSFSLLGRKSSEQSNSLSRSTSMGSLDSVRTDSTEPPIKVGNSTFYVGTPIPTENTDKTATIGGRPGVARRNSTSNLTRVGTPEVPTRSASLTNLNGQSSFSEDVLSDPKVNQYLGNSNKGTLTRSNSFDSARGLSGPSTPTSSLERLEQSFSKDEVGA